MSSRAMRRSLRSRCSTQRSLRPRIDHLESRSLLSTTPLALVAHPTFEIGSLAGGSEPPSGAYTPAQIQLAYGFNNITFGGVAGNGSGETIAIVDANDDPNIQSDLNTFDSEFGLPATTVTRVNETGETSYPASDPTGGWELEESLDVEWAHAMAPGASIMLVETSSDSNSDLLAGVQYAAAHANVVSMSWGGSEFADETAYDTQYFDQAGVTFVASSGDDGAPAEWPAVSPNVLSVGGTALTLGPGNVWSSEVGWSGSGGGPSAYELQPSYQKGVVTQTSSARATPDVAYDASPSTGFAVYDSVRYDHTSGWLLVGGTSAGAPQWSALLAIADQGRSQSGQPALDSSNPQEVMNILYENPADFHDITSGTSTGTPNYSAGPGYDYVTGLGSPIANLIVGSLDGPSTASHDKLVLAAPTAEMAGTSFSLTVTAQTSSGVTDTGYTGTVQFTSSDVQAGLPANFTFTAADAGTSTFTVTLETAGSQSITATDTTASAITDTLSGISVSPAPASQFVLSGLPSTTTAGVAQTVTVTVEDPYGNVATGYGGTVQFTSSDPQASLPANFIFTAADQGVDVFTLAFETAGTQSVTVTDTASGITAAQSGITVQAAAAKSFTVTGFPVVDTAGAPITVTVTAYDAYGNVATGYTGTVSLSSSDPLAILVPSIYTFVAADAGEHNFSITLETAGTQTITATGAVTASLTATESSITVKPAAASILEVTGFPTSDTAGTAGNVVVTAYDPYGNVATGYTGTVSLSSSDPRAVLPSSFTFPGTTGTYIFAVTLETAGAQSITATDTATSSITGTETGIMVQAAAASILEVTGFPTSDTAGAAGNVVVTAYDPYGNVATGYTGTVSLTSSDPLAVLPSSFTFPGTTGTHTFAVTLETVGAQSITTTDTATSSITGTESGITVSTTPQVTWRSPTPIVYGTLLGTAQLDASANVPGTFTYTPAAGNLLDAGSGQTLSVTFTPQDATDYTTAAATTTITVTKATPILKVADAGGRFDGSPFPASATIAGVIAGVDSTPASSLDNITPTLTYYDGSGIAGTSLGPTPPSAPGTYTVVAAFPGNVNYSAVLSTPLSFTIGQGAATLALASSGGSAVYGQPVSLMATVGADAGTPSGTVTFSDGATWLATVPLDGSGAATFTTSALSLGSHSITATYSGDADFLGVQSAPYSETVAQTGTEVVVVENSVFKKKKLMSVRLTSEIKPLAPGGGVPTGEVTFELVTTSKKKVKVTTLGTAAVSGGEATLTLKANKVPQKGITIVYSGDANDKASTVTTPKLT